MDSGVLAAMRLMPRHKTAIAEMALRSQSFRALCEDIAEAESALRQWQKSMAPEHAGRCDELKQLIDELEAELRRALREVR